jgi:hypothetical protein
VERKSTVGITAEIGDVFSMMVLHYSHIAGPEYLRTANTYSNSQQANTAPIKIEADVMICVTVHSSHQA